MTKSASVHWIPPIDPEQPRRILITGGAGFIGSNLAERLLGLPNAEIRILDNLSRAGVHENLRWLRTLRGAERLDFIEADIRDAGAVAHAVDGITEIYHLAAQVAVTTSIEQPASDLHINLLGTFNVLEAARRSPLRPFLLFTSTNKVYGSLAGHPVQVEGSRYKAINPQFRGVSEDEPLDFHSPYGCSKGAADQYVRDYARIYDLPTVVFRMSCIAGPRQFGTEDQGWVAHFLYSMLERRPINIYGDGFQVRDILHVSDLVDSILAAYNHRDRTSGQVYNLGGGVSRSMSVLEMLRTLAHETGLEAILHYSPTRPGDQPLYISDTSRLTSHTGWVPQRSCAQTLQSIHRFWRDHRSLLETYRSETQTTQVDFVTQEVA